MSGNSCCSFNNPPWFHKQLPEPTTDDMEMRVCADELQANEDIGIESFEIYVRAWICIARTSLVALQNSEQHSIYNGNGHCM